MNELPLPEPCVWTDWTSIYSLDLVQSNKRLLRDAEGLFDADQMREYAAAAVAAAVLRMQSALNRIAALNPAVDSKDGYNEWGEADCFNQAQDIARAALLEKMEVPR